MKWHWLILLSTFFAPGLMCMEERVLETYYTHPCLRPCVMNKPLECHYEFYVETYVTLSKACYKCPLNTTDCFRPHCIPADGRSRGIRVVNRMLPGPAIHVCQNDTVIVRVVNELIGGDATSIHWHGILQHGSQHMDGVGMVTQCPIPPAASFEYKFKVDTPGTHFWHAHPGLQRADGIFGALIVRQPDEFESHLGLYEKDLPEHTMLVHDWLAEMSVERFVYIRHGVADLFPRSILINGKGMFQDFLDSSDNTTKYTPVEVFNVTQGLRYRFRVISNGILNCPLLISVDHHNLTMISSDGNPFEKTEVESFNIYSGERFDFVLNATEPVGNYWIRVRGLYLCEQSRAKQVAILRYEGAPDKNPAGNITWQDADRKGKMINPLNKKGDPDTIPVSNLSSRLNNSNNIALKETPDKKFYLPIDFYKKNSYLYHHSVYYPVTAMEPAQQTLLAQINKISFMFPPSPPLSQHSELNESIFCNADTVKSLNCSYMFCECVHRLQVALNDVVELVMIDEGITMNSAHPMHIHGYQFYVVGMDRLGSNTTEEEVKRLDDAGNITRNLVDPVLKDTVIIPDGGYTIVRFHADNPGIWFFHCHVELHLNVGMALLIQVGNTSGLPKVPKDFPKCGTWKFTGYSEEKVELSTPATTCVGGATSLIGISYYIIGLLCLCYACL